MTVYDIYLIGVVMDKKELESLIRGFIEQQVSDEDLTALRIILNDMDRLSAIRLANMSIDPKVLLSLMPIIGPAHSEAYAIADKKVQELFPEIYAKMKAQKQQIANLFRHV